jgi:hypothetical protein
MFPVTSACTTPFNQTITTNSNCAYHLLDRILNLLENENIQQDPNLHQILRKKAKLLFSFNLSSPLSPTGLVFYNCTLMLLDKTNKIRSFVLNKLQQTHAKQIGPGSIAPLVFEESQPAVVLPDIAFGKTKWATYFGDIGEEPPLPDNINEILERPCPLSPGKKIKETHLLVLIPATVNGYPFTLNSLGALIQEPKKGFKTHYTDCDFLVRDYRDLPVQRSYWVLMSRDIVHGSKYNTYQAHNQIVANLAQNTGIPYTVPKVLEATTCILMHHLMTGERLYTDDPTNTHKQTYTRCQEFSNQKQEWTFVVGNFSEESFCISDSHYSIYDGVGVVWSFEPADIAPISAPALPLIAASVISQPNLNTLSDYAFGKTKWAIHFGDIGEEPPLPDNIHEMLAGPCPVWEGRTVQETHILVLIPATVNGIPFNLRSLGELIQNPRQGYTTKYRNFDLGQHPDSPAKQSYWALMSRIPIQGSRTQNYPTQQRLITALTETTGISYQVPKLLEAATCLLMHYVSTGQRLYNDNPWTFTRCQEIYDADWPLVIGGFNTEGLSIDCHYCGHFDGNDIGVGVIQVL